MSLTVPDLKTLANEIADELGESTGDSAVVTRIKRWIQETFEDIHSRRPDWRWTRDYKMLTVLPPYTTGTVDVTNGSTTVVGTGTAWDTSWVNRVLWISGGSLNYKVSSVTDTTHLELDVAYQESTALAQAYTLVQEAYRLDNQAYEAGIVEIINPYADDPLEEKDLKELVRLSPKRRDIGQPTYYAVWGQATRVGLTGPGGTDAGAPLIYFDKYPSVQMAMPYFFHKQFERIGDINETFPLPQKFYRQILTAGVKVRAAEFDENGQLQSALAKYEGLIQLMIQENTILGKRTRRFKETDVSASDVDTFRLPSGYPDVSGGF